MKQTPCPRWCVVEHGVRLGEDDWLHSSAPVSVADGLTARLCMSVDPGTGAEDGPYVVIGSSEYTVAEARALGFTLIALAESGSPELHTPGSTAHEFRSIG